MCGRYRLPSAEENSPQAQRVLQAVRSLYSQAPEERKEGQEDCLPGQALPAYTPNGPALVRWGLAMPGRRGNPLINLRAESALEKPFFRRALTGSGRCLFPAAAYQEGSKDGQRLLFRPVAGGLLFLAGVLLPPAEPRGLPRALVLTTEANDSVRPFHHRMPLILPAEQCRPFLFRPERLEALLAQRPALLQPILLP